MRERRVLLAFVVRDDGITPARAGKTQLLPVVVRSDGDHPRSCGKDIEIKRHSEKRSGSPPLVRERLAVPDINIAFP